MDRLDRQTFDIEWDRQLVGKGHYPKPVKGSKLGTFSGLAASKKHKLYIVRRKQLPLYVGATNQLMSARLRLGCNGTKGYRGYRWLECYDSAEIDIWGINDPAVFEGRNLKKEFETIEAELVFEIRRKSNQWPLKQTEIHFHRSSPLHREIAIEILGSSFPSL